MAKAYSGSVEPCLFALALHCRAIRLSVHRPVARTRPLLRWPLADEASTPAHPRDPNPLPQIRSLTGRRTDLSKLAKPVKVPTGAAAGELAGWPHSKLQVGWMGLRVGEVWPTVWAGD